MTTTKYVVETLDAEGWTVKGTSTGRKAMENRLAKLAEDPALVAARLTTERGKVIRRIPPTGRAGDVALSEAQCEALAVENGDSADVANLQPEPVIEPEPEVKDRGNGKGKARAKATKGAGMPRGSLKAHLDEVFTTKSYASSLTAREISETPSAGYPNGHPRRDMVQYNVRHGKVEGYRLTERPDGATVIVRDVQAV